MKVLVANLGSTSFKYRLFDMADERQLARGGVERIGGAVSPCFVEINGVRTESEETVPNHGTAVDACIGQLTDAKSGCLKDASLPSVSKPSMAVGFQEFRSSTTPCSMPWRK